MELHRTEITRHARVDLHTSKVWSLWTDPTHIVHWNHASDDWSTTYAENDFTAGERFIYLMAAMDGSFSFDFTGVYTEIIRF